VKDGTEGCLFFRQLRPIARILFMSSGAGMQASGIRGDYGHRDAESFGRLNHYNVAITSQQS